jgi:hypothetical protein
MKKPEEDYDWFEKRLLLIVYILLYRNREY